MKKLALLFKLNRWLLDDMPAFKARGEAFPLTEEAQWRLFRSLVNRREPRPLDYEFLSLQRELLQGLKEEKGIVSLSDLHPLEGDLYLWQGDITRLKVDAIVNAANSGLTGCYVPMHSCIDNAIHTFAGSELRLECAQIMEKQGFPEPTGGAKITKAYNLPCRYVIHTVGPLIEGAVTHKHRQELASCYRACLSLADREGLSSLAFCCISTGLYHFPNQEAAKLAVQTVRDYKKTRGSSIKILFDVFTEEDLTLYRQLLQKP